MPSKSPSAPRVVALVGPYLSGKTSLMESLLFVAGTLSRKGSVKDGNTVGDSSPEAKARKMSVEVNIAAATYHEESWTILDCPGSVELMQEAMDALTAADIAVVTCEADPARAITVAPLLKFLDERKIPHLLFVNKMEQANAAGMRAMLEAMQAISERPLVLREVPIREGETITGYVDLVSERAYHYRPGKASDLVKMPASVTEREQEARRELLEHLADFDDHLLEELLEEVQPPREEIYQSMAKDIADDLIVPVFFGSALNDFGVRRLWKALRHDAPGPEIAAKRLGVSAGSDALAQVFKTVHAAHSGKLSFARIWRGEIADGQSLGGARVGGLFKPTPGSASKIAKASLGDVVALGRLDSVATGAWISVTGSGGGNAAPAPLPPLFSLALKAVKKADDVKLTSALTKLTEEDPSLSFVVNADTQELVLWGQGEIHLQIAQDRLKSKFGLDVAATRAQVPYKETIRKSAKEHGRYKRQSGGHGQFGDIHIEIRPQPRGAGFAFADTIAGGAVPKQYIPSVEEGVIEYLARGPFGFPVVDVAVTLTDGSYHSVDSSDAAFKQAARIAMTEAMPRCEPVLLEPILHVAIAVPSDYTAKAQRVISGRRGQILGFDAKEGWKGWDQVNAYLPQAEMHDLIIELRSLTMGVGTFAWGFDHLQELTGKAADKVVETRKSILDAAH